MGVVYHTKLYFINNTTYKNFPPPIPHDNYKFIFENLKKYTKSVIIQQVMIKLVDSKSLINN